MKEAEVEAIANSAIANDFYKAYLVRYMLADEATRTASREHWTKCHMKNLSDNREDLIIFSASMLAMVCLADELTKKVLA